jgi:hypothetical protein
VCTVPVLVPLLSSPWSGSEPEEWPLTMSCSRVLLFVVRKPRDRRLISPLEPRGFAALEEENQSEIPDHHRSAI